MKKIITLVSLLLLTVSLFSQDITKCTFYQNLYGDVMYGNTLRGKVGRLFIHSPGDIITLNKNNDFPGGVNIGTQATFKDHGMILGQQRIATNDGEIDRLLITPYRHAGMWRFTSRDIGPNAFLDINYSTNKNLLTIQHQGNIGLGVANPKNKLEVNGTIRAKEVKIEATGWADFVFKSDYTLPPLGEVENHIKEYQHLPNIPSEAEVMENGINMGEMQVKLLQKIEELTLYVIDLKKENEKQNSLIHDLQEKLMENGK